MARLAQREAAGDSANDYRPKLSDQATLRASIDRICRD